MGEKMIENKVEDVAEDLSDPAVQARLAAFVKNRHYPADTYRVQDSCANCAHVFVREEYEGNDELFCTFNAPPRPPCMSIFMGECDPLFKPWKSIDENQEKWDAWKAGRQVATQGICGEWQLKDATA